MRFQSFLRGAASEHIGLRRLRRDPLIRAVEQSWVWYGYRMALRWVASLCSSDGIGPCAVVWRASIRPVMMSRRPLRCRALPLVAVLLSALGGLCPLVGVRDQAGGADVVHDMRVLPAAPHQVARAAKGREALPALVALRSVMVPAVVVMPPASVQWSGGGGGPRAP